MPTAPKQQPTEYLSKGERQLLDSAQAMRQGSWGITPPQKIIALCQLLANARETIGILYSVADMSELTSEQMDMVHAVRTKRGDCVIP